MIFNSLLDNVKDGWDAGWQRWLVRRVPPSREVTLDQKNLFIFPSPAGFLYLLLLLGLVIGAINYENNMLFISAFLLAGLFVVGILHTFGNLAGLTLRAGHAQPVFAGHDVRFNLALRAGSKSFHDSVVLQWGGSDFYRAAIDVENEELLHIHVPTTSRGWFHPGRLLVQSWYPLGLIRTWSRIDLDTRVLVYPRPVAAPPLPDSHGKDQHGTPMLEDGGEDFTGFRRYQLGDPLRRVAWKAAAKVVRCSASNMARMLIVAFGSTGTVFAVLPMARLDCRCCVTGCCTSMPSEPSTVCVCRVPRFTRRVASNIVTRFLRALALFNLPGQAPG